MAVGDLAYSKKSSSDAGRLIYKTGTNDGQLCYKSSPIKHVCISFGWSGEATDLDICGYWTGAPDLKVGYSYNTSTSVQTSGIYNILYSGDIRGSGAAEWVEVWMSKKGTEGQFRIHFNFYGEAGPGICNIVATQANGKTFTITDFTCSTWAGQPATVNTSPYVTVSIDASGNLTNLE